MTWNNDVPELFSAKAHRLLNPAFSGNTLTIGEVLNVLGRPTLLSIILLLALLVIVMDAIPGASFILGIALTWFSIQFAIGRATPWLPGKVKHHQVSSARLAPWLSNLTRVFELLENIAHPRYTLFAERPYALLTAFLMAILSVFIALPVPFGDVVPAIAVALLALGQLEFDGALIAIGQIIGLIALGALCVVGLLMIGGAEWAMMITG